MDTWIICCSFLVKRDILHMFLVCKDWSCLSEYKEVWLYCFNQYTRLVIEWEQLDAKVILSKSRMLTVAQWRRIMEATNLVLYALGGDHGLPSLQGAQQFICMQCVNSDIETLQTMFHLKLCLYHLSNETIFLNQAMNYHHYLLRQSYPFPCLQIFKWFDDLAPDTNAKYEWFCLGLKWQQKNCLEFFKLNFELFTPDQQRHFTNLIKNQQ